MDDASLDSMGKLCGADDGAARVMQTDEIVLTYTTVSGICRIQAGDPVVVAVDENAMIGYVVKKTVFPSPCV